MRVLLLRGGFNKAISMSSHINHVANHAVIKWQSPTATSSRASSERWKSIGSSVLSVTLSPRLKNLGKGELRALRKRKWFEIGEIERPT